MPDHNSNLPEGFRLSQTLAQKMMVQNFVKPHIHEVLLDISQYITLKGCMDDLSEAYGEVAGYINRLVKEYEPAKKG
jgi:hypothetical protein